ncbi:hypothetical protein [Burkholderia glumae]|uniref:hypothetical protein n=1 Tax=Burkholderia glumae TaxID=337 RepID=UPI0021519E18|nr:hypothetical protein [Burkholderia glumae]
MTNNTTAAETLTLHERNLVERLRDANRDIFPSHRNGLIALIERLTSPRAAVPEGWKLVPVEPTPEMVSAGEHVAYSDVAYAPPEIAYRAMLDAAPAAPVADKPAPTLILTGAQLLEALDFIAPDRSADQLESEVSFQHGNGHAGEGMYCWMTEYPDEGAMKIDGSTLAAQAVAAPVAEYDGNHVQNHCTECNEHEAECSCAQAVAADGAQTFEQWFSSLPPQHRALIGDVRDARMGFEAARAAVSPATAEDGGWAAFEPWFERAWLLNPDKDFSDRIRCKAWAWKTWKHLRGEVPVTADTTWTSPKQHCQNGGDVCLAGDRDGVCCPEDSCDIDDGTRKNPAALPIKIPHVHIRPEDEDIGRQYYALGFVDGNRSITDAPQPARVVAPKPATADERAALREMLDDARNEFTMVREALGVAYEPHQTLLERTLDAARASQAAAPASPTAEVPIELADVKETLAKGDGFWRSCSGCHETEDGHPVGKYPYSAILKCYLGAGCSECGGIGAVWDNTDYGAMGNAFERAGLLNSPNAQAALPADARGLSLMRKAFRVTEVGGDPDPAKQTFTMRFSFRSIEALHAADDEWRKFIAAPADARELVEMIDNNVESLNNLCTAADEKALTGLSRALRKVSDTLTRCRAAVSIRADAGEAVAIGFRTRIPGFDWVPWLTDNQETIRKAIADALAIGSEASKLYSGPVQGAQGGKGGEA